VCSSQLPTEVELGRRMPEARRLWKPARSSLKILCGARENVKVEAGKMSAAKVPLLSPVEAVAPAKA